MTLSIDQRRFEETLDNARQALLDARDAAGHWEGRLSSSPLSTATAVATLSLFQRARSQKLARDEATTAREKTCEDLIRAGHQWLQESQNPDGGWGDTTLSLSNISTTVLCWAALGMRPERGTQPDSIDDSFVERAEHWLIKAAGAIEPVILARAIVNRYGRDHTFSVPILTMCVLTGRFGEPAAAWKLVPQLPFEIAALPRIFFRWLRLPVVSYALPALIAIGQVRHRGRPAKNPLMRLLRRLASARTLRVLSTLQPAGGGFLEATPLTSFVTMSLIGSGLADHSVVAHGIDFLIRSAREDGSWPIDTNLSTWVTTLAINALIIPSQPTGELPENRSQNRLGKGDSPQFCSADHRGDGARAKMGTVPGGFKRGAEINGYHLVRWLLDQQYRKRHVYTGAAAGGWAWTDLPGGVPDADDTAGALLALRNLDELRPDVTAAAELGITWLVDLQNRDGGIPTFCQGWGTLPFDRSGPDLTAHALHAWAVWSSRLAPPLRGRVERAMSRGLRYLERSQRADGAWPPLWFGNQHSVDDQNLTYGTSRVLSALFAIDAKYRGVSEMNAAAVRWLLAAQNEDGSWGGDQNVPGSLEETSLAVTALARHENSVSAGQPMADPPAIDDRPTARCAIAKGLTWIMDKSDAGTKFAPAPIGFYFAKLWYYEELYPLIWVHGALVATRHLLTATGQPSASEGIHGQSS